MRLKELSIIQYQNVSGTYHYDKLWISVDAFKKQLDHFSNNFHVLSMDDSIDFMERGKGVHRARPIALTFDNGYYDLYQSVYPLLSAYAFPCTVLISPSKVGKKININGNSVSYLTWDNLRELGLNNITIGPYEDQAWNINRIPEETAARHISNYKKIMEDKLGIEVRYFGVKEGVPNKRIRELLISEGYRAFLTECPTNRKPDLYSLGRIQVDDNDFNIFLTKVSKTYLFFKDKKSWKYIREYKLDKVAHRISETWDSIRTVQKP